MDWKNWFRKPRKPKTLGGRLFTFTGRIFDGEDGAARGLSPAVQPDDPNLMIDKIFIKTFFNSPYQIDHIVEKKAEQWGCSIGEVYRRIDAAIDRLADLDDEEPLEDWRS